MVVDLGRGLGSIPVSVPEQEPPDFRRLVHDRQTGMVGRGRGVNELDVVR
jgi:hypothetical protein